MRDRAGVVLGGAASGLPGFVWPLPFAPMWVTRLSPQLLQCPRCRHKQCTLSRTVCFVVSSSSCFLFFFSAFHFSFWWEERGWGRYWVSLEAKMDVSALPARHPKGLSDHVMASIKSRSGRQMPPSTSQTLLPFAASISVTY